MVSEVFNINFILRTDFYKISYVFFKIIYML